MHSQRETQMKCSWGTPSCSQRSGTGQWGECSCGGGRPWHPSGVPEPHGCAEPPHRGGGDRRSWPHGHALAARPAGWAPHQNCQQLKQRQIEIWCFALLVCCRTFWVCGSRIPQWSIIYEYTNTMTEFNCFKSVGSRNNILLLLMWHMNRPDGRWGCTIMAKLHLQTCSIHIILAIQDLNMTKLIWFLRFLCKDLGRCCASYPPYYSGGDLTNTDHCACTKRCIHRAA